MTSNKMENILIIDDEKIIIGLLQQLLQDEGRIDVAYNGRMALDLINERYYKVIISDIQMPIMDGITLYTRASEKFPNMRSRFLFITGSMYPSYLSFLEKNSLNYLLKPVEVKDFKERVRQMVLS